MISRGQVYFVDLNPIQGREQAGRRPCLVVSSDAINCQPLVVTVVVGTKSSRIQRDYPVNVRVSAKESGLPEDTTFLCFQVRSLDPARFMDPQSGRAVPAGRLPAHRMAEIDEALKLVLDLA
jgi:mRNA interferase MazF